MKSLKTILAGFVVTLALAGASFAQSRQVELRLTAPVKGEINAKQAEIAGKVYLPVGNFTVVGDLGYRETRNLFFNPAGLPNEVDVVNAGGEVWYYFTGREKRVFVTGGIARSAFLGEDDSTQAVTGIGVAFHKGEAYVIPVFSFSSDDLEDGRTILGKGYKLTTHVMLPLSSTFNFNVTPEISRVQEPVTARYVTQAKVSLGISIKR